MTTRPYRLDGRTVAVTGAGAGIGLSVAEHFARQGASVVVNDIDGDAADAAAQRLHANAEGAAVSVAADVTSADGARRVVDLALERFGGLDVLVNNAAAHVELSPFAATDPETWPAAMSSLYATLHMTHAALPGMTERGFGRIVNVTSIAGDFGVVDMSVYGAAKGGIHAFTKSVAKETAGSGITVNCVAPGTVDTPRQQSRPAAVRRRRQQAIPVGRFATSDEVAHAVLFLALDASAYITGEVLCVDGGRP